MATQTTRNMRRLGALLLIGVAAGVGARYVLTRAAKKAQEPQQLIDWTQARRVALMVSQSEQFPVQDHTLRQAQYQRMVETSEPLIAAYMGVSLPNPITRVQVVDRRAWLEANFTSFAALFGPIEALLLQGAYRRTPLGTLIASLSSAVVGAETGALLGYLARRVLGQYDLSLFSPTPQAGGALFFVEPNIARVQTELGISDEEFRLWIVLHETSHVFEFEAHPWVRDYFQDLLQSFLRQSVSQASLSIGFTQLIERMRHRTPADTHWIERILTPEQRQLFDRMQALMSLVEGYSNHIMNVIGRQVLPGFQLIEARMSARKQQRPLVEELFNRITGMDLKLAQYQQGERFVDAIVAARGASFVNRVWERPEHLPTMDEIRAPERWIARMGG